MFDPLRPCVLWGMSPPPPCRSTTVGGGGLVALWCVGGAWFSAWGWLLWVVALCLLGGLLGFRGLSSGSGLGPVRRGCLIGLVALVCLSGAPVGWVCLVALGGLTLRLLRVLCVAGVGVLSFGPRWSCRCRGGSSLGLALRCVLLVRCGAGVWCLCRRASASVVVRCGRFGVPVGWACRSVWWSLGLGRARLSSGSGPA